MEVSPRARLAWANRNLEKAADIIVADWLREMDELGFESNPEFSFAATADHLDPEGAQS